MQCGLFFFNVYICSKQEEFIGSSKNKSILSGRLKKGLEILRIGERQCCMDEALPIDISSVDVSSDQRYMERLKTEQEMIFRLNLISEFFCNTRCDSY